VADIDSVCADRGVVKVCDKNNKLMDRDGGLWAVTGCATGNAYLCDTYQPVPVEADLSYGFAIQIGGNTVGDNPNCCKCIEIQWLSGQAAGKKMIAQVVTPGGRGNGIVDNDIIILTPGGGVGPFANGCRNQYGNSYSWYVSRAASPQSLSFLPGSPPNMHQGQRC
jgi:hypothetical protein